MHAEVEAERRAVELFLEFTKYWKCLYIHTYVHTQAVGKTNK